MTEEQKQLNTTTQSPTWKSWLPSRGSVLFTLLAIATLVFAQRAGTFGQQGALASAMSLNTIPYQGRLADSSSTPLDGSYSMDTQALVATGQR